MYYLFTTTDLFLGKPSKLFERNHPDWIPSVNIGYSKKFESLSHHSSQLKRNLKKDYVTHKDINNLEAQSLLNAD